MRGFLLLVLSLLSCIAIMVNPDSLNIDSDIGYGVFALFTLLRSELREVEVSHVFAAVFLICLYSRTLMKENDSFCISAFIVSFCLDLFLIIGMSFSATSSFDFIVGNKYQILIAATVFIGFWVMLYTMCKLLYKKMDTFQLRSREYSGICEKIDKHFFLFSFVTILLFWLILALPFFPGSVAYDGRNQLNQYFGLTELNLHHPYFATKIMGFVYSLGAFLGGSTGGCVFYVLFQSTIGAVIFGRICRYILDKSRSLPIAICCVVFYSISPMWWSFAESIIKDTLYLYAFSWFVLEYVKLFLKDNNKFTIPQLIIAAILTCILRNGSCYIVLPALLVLIFISSYSKVVLCIVFAVITLSNYCLNTVLMNELGLKSDNQVEMFSIPLQQIARYVTEYEDELTDEEKQIIDRVVKYEGIPERYNPENSDPIKNHYRSTTEEEWSAFWKLWLSKLKEHPEVYIEATLNNTYGYFDPFYFYYGLTAYPIYNKDAISDYDIGINYSIYSFSDNTRKGMTNVVYAWNKVPLLSFIVNPAFYTWLTVILLGGLLRKKKWRYACVCVIPILNILICVASPVNGLVRYALPVMGIMPLLILMGIEAYSGICMNKMEVHCE
jgi:hypothetical protein